MAKTKLRHVLSAVYNMGGKNGHTELEIAKYLTSHYGKSTPVELARNLHTAVGDGLLTLRNYKYYPLTSKDFNAVDIIELRRRRRMMSRRRRSRSKSRRGDRRSRRSRRGRRHDDDDKEDNFVDAKRRRRSRRPRRGRRHHQDNGFVDARRRKNSRPRRRRVLARQHATEKPDHQNVEGQGPTQSNGPQVPH